MKHKRPKSSTNPLNSKKSFTHATPPKDFRVNEQDVYNYVRNSVHLTFQGSSSRNYELIK